MNANGRRRVGNGRGPRNTVFGRIRTRARGGSTNGEARTRSRRGMNQLMAIG